MGLKNDHRSPITEPLYRPIISRLIRLIINCRFFTISAMKGMLVSLPRTRLVFIPRGPTVRAGVRSEMVAVSSSECLAMGPINCVHRDLLIAFGRILHLGQNRNGREGHRTDTSRRRGKSVFSWKLCQACWARTRRIHWIRALINKRPWPLNQWAKKKGLPNG